MLNTVFICDICFYMMTHRVYLVIYLYRKISYKLS